MMQSEEGNGGAIHHHDELEHQHQKRREVPESLEVTVEKYKERISYSHYFYDDDNEYRHVILPKPIAEFLPKNKLLSEKECEKLGVAQSPGWRHYMIHNPEPHVLMFKREKNYRQKYLVKSKK